jgi:hypothetical protein
VGSLACLLWGDPTTFWFVVFPVPQKETRLMLESRIISTVSRCPICRPSAGWLGLHSPKEKIRASGLWIVNELYKQPFSQAEFDNFKKYLMSLQSNPYQSNSRTA